MHELDKTLEALKPCPFCGPGQSQVDLWHDDVAKRWRVGCGRCGCSTGISPRDKTQAPAIAAWNRRASTTSAGVTEEQAPRVKLLVWRDHGPDSFPEPAWSAQTPFGFYNMEEVSASDSPAYVVRLHAHHFIADKDSLDEAKAAAQADYEKRILSALEASRVAPVSQKEAEPVAWEYEWENPSADGATSTWERCVALHRPTDHDFYPLRNVRPLYASPAPAVEPVGIKADDRLYNADEPMADGEIEMTAAENVLAWLIIEKIGVPDDRNYSPNEAREIVVHRLDYANELENESLRSALHSSPTPVSAPVGESEA